MTLFPCNGAVWVNLTSGFVCCLHFAQATHVHRNGLSKESLSIHCNVSCVIDTLLNVTHWNLIVGLLGAWGGSSLPLALLHFHFVIHPRQLLSVLQFLLTTMHERVSVLSLPTKLLSKNTYLQGLTVYTVYLSPFMDSSISFSQVFQIMRHYYWLAAVKIRCEACEGLRRKLYVKALAIDLHH